jgi:flagellar biogenesis protein FliO
VYRRLLLALFLSIAAWSPFVALAANSGAATQPTTHEEARIPFKTSAETDGAGIAMRVIGGFIVVALLALAAVYTLKRFFPSFYVHTAGGAKRIQVLEIRRLTPRTTLFVVELDGTRLLLAQSGDRIVNLHKTPVSGIDSSITPDL